MAARRGDLGPGCLYDVVVIGAGIQGTFTAYHLAKRGQRTLLLEQFFLPHTRGSSHGQSRIIRRAYPQDYYSAMMPEAYRLWAEVETEAHTKLYRPTPMFVLGRQGSPGFESFSQSMKRHGVPHEVLSARDLAGKFPGLCLNEGEMAVSDLTAGILYADRALKTVQDLFRQSGGTVRDGEKVLSILPGMEVTVTTSQGTYHTKRLVVTAGAWANRLLDPLGVRLPLQPLCVTVCYWKAKDQRALDSAEKLPCFLGIGLDGNKHDIYGLPAGEYPGLVKICYHYGTPVDPDRPDQPNSSGVSDVHILQRFVRKYLPVLDPEPAVQERCLYTNTPDEDFVLDCHPRFRNIVIGAGFSGHGFKFAPVTGKILCELSLGEKPSYNLKPFQINRFASVLKSAM